MKLHRKLCQKHKKQIEKIQESYDALRSRRFRVRRGRNNRILYKSQLKTIYGYDSSDNQDLTHDVTDDLLIKINDRANKRQKREHKKNKFSNELDKILLNEKMLADDLEKYCANKRLKKNIYKLDMMHCTNNGQKVGIESAAFTSASCDLERIPRVTTDPVINSMLKRVHAPAY